MPFPNEAGTPSSAAERVEPSDGMTRPLDPGPPQKLGHPNSRHLGEICPEVMLIMPFTVPLLLTTGLRKWLRRRVGRKVGNVVGKAAIIAIGGPPLLVAFVTVLLMRLVLAVLDRLDRAVRAWRGALRPG